MNRWRSFLAALGVAVVGATGYFLTTDDGRTISQPRERLERGRFGRNGPRVGQDFALDKEYLYPSASPHPPDPVNDPVFGTGARRPQAVCYVGAVTGSTTAFECKGRDGLAFGTMFNNSAGTTVASSTAGIRVMQVTHASAGDSPELRSATLDSIISSGTYTVLVYTHPKFNADNYYWVLKRAGGTSGNLNIFSTGTSFACSYTIEVTTQVGFPIGSWGFLGCSTSGGTASTVTYQYSSTTETIAAEVAIAGTGNWVFGNRSSVSAPFGDLGQDGMIGWYAFYDVALTAAEKQSTHDAAVGAYNTAGSLTVGSPLAIGIDHTATSGQVEMVDGTNNLVAPGGLVVSKGFQNVWNASPLAAASWTSVGTPIVTSNVSSGPFSVWGKAAECDLIEDDAAGAFEGKQSDSIAVQADGGVATGFYDASCFLKSGTTGTTTTKGRIAFTATGGTLSVTACDFTGLTSTASRKECSTRLSTTATDLKASVLVGNATSDTGSIQTCQCQLTAGRPLQPPMPTNTLVSRISYEIPSSAGWATAANGAKYEVVHTPKMDPDTEWLVAANDTYYLFDPTTSGGVAHAGTLIYGYQNPGDMYSQGIVTHIGPLTVGSPVVWSLEWRPTSGGNGNLVVRHNQCGATPGVSCRASTVVDSASNTALPGQPGGTTCIGLRCDGSAYGADAEVSAIRTYVLR